MKAVLLTVGVAVAVQLGLAQAGGGQPTAGRGPSAIESLAAAERAFASLAGKIGQLPAFLAYFADDVVTFQPLPASGKQSLRERALAASYPSPYHLDWEPWFADIAGSEDLGYTTGPTLFTDAATGKTLSAGWYFSVWKKDVNGWRVAADIGVEAPPVPALRPVDLRVGVASAQWARPGASGEELLAVERQMADMASSAGLAAACARYAGPSTRVYRNGSAPAVGGEAIAAALAGKPTPRGWRTTHAEVARSGDLAYSYGVYEAAEGPGAAKSAFLHVWKPGPTGWTLAAEVVTAGR